MNGAHGRFLIYNSTGVAIPTGNATIRSRRWKNLTAGKTFDSVQSIFTSSGSISNGAYQATSNIDNTTNLWEKGWYEFKITLSSSGSGDVTLYFDPSVDGSVFPDNAAGYPVARLNFSSTGTKTILFFLGE